MWTMRLFYTYEILFRGFQPSFLGAKKKEEQTAEMVKSSTISDRIAIFGTPEILMAGKDSRFIGIFPMIPLLA